MITKIIKIGKSKGIFLPKNVLEESGIEKSVELKVRKGEIKIVPAAKSNIGDTLLSESSLAADWSRKEEDKAWQDLQKVKYKEN